MNKLLYCLAGLLLSCPLAHAGTVSGNLYVGERFGRLEISSPEGKWDIFDREMAGASDDGGPVVDLQLKGAIGQTRPVVRVTGVRKADTSVTADFVLRTSRDALVQRGGEPGPVQMLRSGEKSVWSYDARLGAQGQAARTRLVVVEGARAFFLLQMVVPAAVFDEASRAFEQLLPTLKY